MTKKEQAYVSDLENQLRLAKALRWTQPVEPDVAPPKPEERGNRLATGYLYNAYFNGFTQGRVEPSCSSSISHNFGSNTKTSSQGARHLYSTPVLAWQAMRYDVEKDCAKRLAYIDKQIEDLLRETDN
jgi:hypothetical protein